ncbi:amino acid ABC transporter substrate-binding protein (PAAT family) [Tumebacillus sp. BK434]|uniref:transporter substrate-binding domain-containing protein n=1 Tax=Tumebacillus sp. BK434 TaxID=2512169 RepID=UPI00104B6841|nr:transporter substrate-binding domain-containing protein [Tumebacillus sp. BK434]TCP58240.1 amino acid ABC transporter substrate-binding protein (PAAT family) [Tumebacillus sp. BK434]
MTKWKKIFSTVFVSSLTAALLVGCGSDSSAPKDNGGDTPSASATLTAIKDRDKLVAGVKYDTNLFGLKDPASGKVAGFDIDIAKALAKELTGDENKIEFKEVTSSTRIPMLNKGDIDIIIATMTITEKRREEVNFSDVYFQAGQSLLVKKGSDITGVDKLDGKTVLAVKGATSGKNVKEKAPGVKVLEFANYAEAFTALKSGKGDALTTDNSILLGMAAQDPNYVLAGDPFSDEPYGIASKKGDDEFTKTLNDFLKGLKDSGEYNKIYKKWFKEDPK